MIEKIKKINKTIIVLTISDVLVWGTYMIAYPLQGIFMTYRYGDKSIQYISIGLSIYFVLRALLQVPIGILVDKTKDDIDEVWSLGLGSFLIGLNFLIFPFTSTPVEYYLLMGMAGVGASFNLIGWRKLFAKNLDKDKEGREYALYETVMSLCTAVFSFIGGGTSSISHEIFRAFFFAVGLVTMIGGIVVTLILIKEKKK
jgi:MFS family permease